MRDDGIEKENVRLSEEGVLTMRLGVGDEYSTQLEEPEVRRLYGEIGAYLEKKRAAMPTTYCNSAPAEENRKC
jgi:hypothetical protein